MVSLYFRRQVLAILWVAFILTVFEILFFYLVVGPTISSRILDAISSMSSSLGSNFPMYKIPGGMINVMTDYEHKLVKQLNWAIGGNILYIAIGLMIGIGGLTINLWDDGIWDASFGFMILLSGLLFILFQVYFFFEISMKYGYPTSEEVNYSMLEGLIENINEKLGVK